MGESGWVTFGGGECPVKVGTTVDTYHRDRTVSKNRKIEYATAWKHLGTPCDIVAYRIVSGPSPPEQPHD